MNTCRTLIGCWFVASLSSCAGEGELGPTALTVRELAARAPLSVPRPSYLQAALLVPPMQTAATLPTQTVVATVSTNHVGAKSTQTHDGVQSWFAGVFHEWLAVDLHYGAAPGLELSARSALSGWDESQDHFSLFDDNGNYIVRDESRLARNMASQRHDNVARLDLGAKVLLFGGDLAQTAAGVAVKLPIARAGDLTSGGTYDFAGTLLESVQLGDFTLHANVGGVVPTGTQTLFDESADIDINPFVQGAAGVTWRAGENWSLILQAEGNTSAFRDVPFLHRGPITFVGGARRSIGSSFVELSGGRGSDGSSSDWWEAFVGFGLQL
ncbi:MAG TPA: hypothetical protein VFZ65_00100 [Planctomycetota bacterium]|nr:hypothetical protein [Planctomycetota bacterium]